MIGDFSKLDSCKEVYKQINELIYSSQISCIGLQESDCSEVINFFRENYNITEIKSAKFRKTLKSPQIQAIRNNCLALRYSNIFPLVFLNGMYLGNMNSLQKIHFRDEFKLIV